MDWDKTIPFALTADHAAVIREMKRLGTAADHLRDYAKDRAASAVAEARVGGDLTEAASFAASAFAGAKAAARFAYEAWDMISYLRAEPGHGNIWAEAMEIAKEVSFDATIAAEAAAGAASRVAAARRQQAQGLADLEAKDTR